MSLQRQPSPSEEADLETTAELPVLDVSAYEASLADTATQPAASDATVSMPIPVGLLERDPLASTDSWRIPSPPPRLSVPVASQAANTAIDENRARLETNLQSLSKTLRDVEERLTRKGERLAEIERALETAVADRVAAEQRARALTDQLTQTRAGATAAQTQVAELQKALQERTSSEEARRARDAELQAQLVARNSQTQAALNVAQRDFESKLTSRDRTVAFVQQELAQARARATGYLEALHSNEGRRSVFEVMISTLDDDVEQRNIRLASLQTELRKQVARVAELESEAQTRAVRIAALDQQVSALTATLNQRAGELGEAERAKDGAQQNIRTLNATLAEREARIRALEETLSHQTLTGGQQRGELERLADERTQLLAAAAVAEASARAATTRADEQETAARLATDRNEDLETAVAAQRRRSEQLETEIIAVRGESRTSAAAVQAAGTERGELTARVTAGEARILELEARVADQQESVRLLQAQSNASLARAKELESDLHAAEEIINQLEAEAGGKRARVEELEKVNQEWRATVEEARHAITDRDALIQRLEQETANSAVLIGHIQKSITRLDHSAEQRGPEPAPDGATRLLIRTDGDMEVVHVLGRKTSVGRTPDNDLQIDAKFISRHHAVILVGPAHAIIEDLNSTNGVLVNNRRITRQPLKDGDNVMIGKTQFRFVVRPAR